MILEHPIALSCSSGRRHRTPRDCSRKGWMGGSRTRDGISVASRDAGKILDTVYMLPSLECRRHEKSSSALTLWVFCIWRDIKGIIDISHESIKFGDPFTSETLSIFRSVIFRSKFNNVFYRKCAIFLRI